MRFVYGHHRRPNSDIDLNPMMEWEMENILEKDRLKYKSALCFPDKILIWGPAVEVGMVETLEIQNSDVFFCEALWQITTPK